MLKNGTLADLNMTGNARIKIKPNSFFTALVLGVIFGTLLKSITLFVGAACRTAIPGIAGLAAVNGAILQMTYTLAKELAPLRVNAISPGMVDTPAYDWINPEQKHAMFEQTGNNLPVKRIGKPEEIAEAVVFLVSNGFVTGTVLDIDGGARLS